MWQSGRNENSSSFPSPTLLQHGARASHAVRRKKSAAKKKARANAMELLQGTLNKKLAGDGSAGDTACAQVPLPSKWKPQAECPAIDSSLIGAQVLHLTTEDSGRSYKFERFWVQAAKKEKKVLADGVVVDKHPGRFNLRVGQKGEVFNSMVLQEAHYGTKWWLLKAAPKKKGKKKRKKKQKGKKKPKTKGVKRKQPPPSSQQAKKRAKRTVQSWSTTQQIVFQQENPKRRQSKSAARYERYKSACTVAEFLGLGGSGGDLLHDCEKGYVREVDSDFLTDSD